MRAMLPLRSLVRPILIGCVAWLVLAIGGAPRWSLVVGAGLVALGLLGTMGSRHTIENHGLVRLLTLLALGCAAMAIPLPAQWIMAFAPESALLRQKSLALADAPARWLPLSGDPIATWESCLFFLTLAGVASLGLRATRTQRGRVMTLFGLAGLGTCVTLITLFHEWFGLTKLYGVYAPTTATPLLLGPLLATNHLASLAAVTSCVSLGLVFYTGFSSRVRVGLLAASVVNGALVFMTTSRGAWVASLFGLSCLGLGLWIHRRKRPLPRAQQLAIALCVVGAIVLVTLLIGINGFSTWEETAIANGQPKGKLALWRPALAMIVDAPWTGHGRGAFEVTIPRYYPEGAGMAYSHLENEYLQLVVDFGIPLTLVVVGFLLGWLRRARRDWRRDSISLASMAGLAVLALQSFVDFAIALPGVAAVAVVLMASLSPATWRVATPADWRRRAGMAVGLLALVGFTWSLPPRLADRPAATASVEETLAHVRAHPLDAIAAGQAGQRLVTSDARRAMGLFAQSIALAPGNPHLHRAAGQALWHLGFQRQAAIEFRFALETLRDPRELVVQLASLLDDETLLRALPMRPRSPTEIAKALVSGKRTSVAATWLERLGRAGLLAAWDLLISLDHDIAEPQLLLAYEARLAAAPLVRHRIALARRYLQLKQVVDAERVLGTSVDWVTDASLAPWAALLACDVRQAKKEPADACYAALQRDPIVGKEALRRLVR